MCQLNCATDVFWRGTMKIKSSPMPMFVNMEKEEKWRECVFPNQNKPNLPNNPQRHAKVQSCQVEEEPDAWRGGG